MCIRDSLNPLDLSISDPELDKENWLCVNSEIINDQIICTIPKLENFHPDCLQFNVDISLNGQQFTGFPSSFRFYNIKIKDIYPKNGTNVGGTTVKVQGEGFFDTIYKKIKFISKLGERLIDVAWDKVNKQFNFVCPPLNWLLGSYEPTPEILTKVKEEPAKIYITFNQIEWIFIGDFSYIEPEIEKFLPVPPYDPSLTEEEKLARWKKPMEEIDPLKGIENEVELAKKKEELRKQAEIDEADINLYRKAGQQLFIIGSNFFQTDPILIQLTSPKKVIVVKGVFKNKTKIGFVIPELEELEKGIHEIQVEVSFNQQQFSLSQKKFKYLAFEPGMPEDQKKKFEDEILKAAKKPPAKK
eukprot:TRINITY_DN16991_c0_g1_i4.p1 TRINITY_DN16991_c0_g1~~TRINITY_DN16991_c0_g1_i4.p1  ORF type:complete len:357 (-),score=85.13 TRINITY_DN16991_c0_g1_i4:22-1092(-)